MHNDELWQEFDKNGERLDTLGWPSSAGNPPVESSSFVAAAAVYLFRCKNNDIEVLFQRRSKSVDRYPLKWDSSAGGHVNRGERIADAAIRELREEIGAIATLDMLQFAYSSTIGNRVNLIRYYFFCDWTDQPDDFHFDDHEVDAVKWVKFEELDAFISEYAKEPIKDLPIERLSLKTVLEKYRKQQ